MVALQVRNVPEDVRDTLMERARAKGQSLQAFLLDLVTSEARRSRNVDVLHRFANRSDGTWSAPGQTASELAQLRDERETTYRSSDG